MPNDQREIRQKQSRKDMKMTKTNNQKAAPGVISTHRLDFLGD